MIRLLPFFLLLLLAHTAIADQRFESWQGLCHFAYDVNDDDNEVYFANCKNTIDTHDAGDGAGRLAHGSSIVSTTYSLEALTMPKFTNGGKLKGVDADPGVYGDDYLTANTACVMVTSNYNAGADDNNETVYVTNDWDLLMTTEVDSSLKAVVGFELNCRNGVQQ